MNGNFRNGYRGGWNGMSREQFSYNYQIPRDRGFRYADDMYLPYQAPTHYYNMWHSTHQMPAHYLNARPLPHQMPAHYAGNMHVTHQRPELYTDKRHLRKQKPEHYADKRPLPQQTPKDFVDKRNLPHQKPEDFADKKNLPHQKPEDYTDKKCLPQQMPEHLADKRDLPQQKPECYADKSPLPDQTPEEFADKRSLPHQKPEDSIDNKCLLPQQTPDLPQQTPEDYADKNGLPHQTSKPNVPGVAPVKRPKSAIVSCEICDVSFPQNNLELHNKGKKHRRNLSKLCGKSTKHETSKEHHVIQNCAMKRNDQSKSILHALAGSNTSALTKDTYSGSDAIAPPQGPMTSQINSQTKVKEGKEHHEVQNGGVKDCAAKKCLSHQMPKPTIPSDKKSESHCEICHAIISSNYIEQHNNGRKHQRNIKLMEQKISKGEVSGHIQNSQMNPVVQPKKVPKSKKGDRPVENMSQFRCKEVPVAGSKRKLGDHTVAKDHGFKVKKVKNEAPSFDNKKIPAERSKRKVSDTTDAKDHGSKCEIGETLGAKYMKTNSGIRRPMKSSKSEVNTFSNSVKSLVQIPESIPPSGRVVSPKMAPIPVEISSFELESQHVSTSLSQESKGKEHHRFQNTTVEKNDQTQSTPVELNASEGSNRTESMSCDFTAIAPPQVPVNSLVFTPSPAVESSLEPSIQIDSQIEVEEGKENHDVQNCCIETNDQPQSITMELHANGGSDINTLIKEDTCSDSGAIVIIPSQSPIASQVATPVAAVESSFEPESQQVIQTEMSDGKVHNEIQNHTVDSNDEQRPISMELDDPAGCMTNIQTEVVNSDSAAIVIVIEPLASAPPDAVWSGFEPPTDSEIEPQVSEHVYYESHHPIEETDIELPPSIPVEIDAASEVSTETETTDGSPQTEVEMDVLVDELGIIQLPQVSVCLTCGDEGFEEAIVYCYKCKGYAIHRYCLDGPVVFTDEVIWFCMDCEEEVIDTDYPDQVTSDSEKGEVDCSDGCVMVVDPQPIADPIWGGSLQVSHKSDDKITRLMAHLSTLACPKVLEETRHLPNVLFGNLLQRSAVWPASFTKFGTNNLSIGLYFFPQNERVERYYDQLVHEMISNDLAISTRVEKSELLIFTSTMLPSQYKRFQSKYYLWGIFIRKQTPSKINNAGS